MITRRLGARYGDQDRDVITDQRNPPRGGWLGVER